MIYCVWYPSGGFGHFINAILSLHGTNFARPNNKLSFSSTGDSHSLDLVVPKYFHNQPYPQLSFDPNLNYSVLIDNGINDQGKEFSKVFDDCKIVKMCYDDYSWPIVAKTQIVKASRSTLEKELPLDNWDTRENWSIREKYTLYLRDHYLRKEWRTDEDCLNLNIYDLHSHQKLVDFFNVIGEINNFEQLHTDWWQANYSYFFPVEQSLNIIDAVKLGKNIDIDHITDLWDQAVVNYTLMIEFNIDIPVNDYKDWFQNTKQIIDLL